MSDHHVEAPARSSQLGPVVLRAHGICKTYESAAGTLDVLKGIDLEVRRGEVLSIMGQSGVGKSTLLNILGLLDQPTSGRLEFQAAESEMVDTTRMPLRQRAKIRNERLGFVFQFFHLLPDLNVLENVLLPSMIHHGWFQYHRRRAALREHARALLAQVNVDRERHRPNQLSGGERQRVAIARALMNKPQIVLCDEPTGNLDTGTSEQIHGLFDTLNRQLGTSFLIVTHETALAARTDRCLVMTDGSFNHEDSSGTP